MRKDFALLYVDIIETLANANVDYDSFAISAVVLFVKNEMVWRFFILCQLLNYFILAQSLLHFHRHGPRLVTLQKWHWHCFLDKVDTENDEDLDKNKFSFDFEQ